MWVWDEELGCYQDTTTGDILCYEDVNELIDRSLDGSILIVAGLALLLAAGTLSVQAWQDEMIEAIRMNYAQQALLAGGGVAQMSRAEWDVIGSIIREQYRYLHSFAEEVAAGHLTEGQITMRSRMYINSARSAYWRIRDEREGVRGMAQERWHAIGDANTCEACSDADAMGWQPLGTFGQPGSGTVLIDPLTQCSGLTSCRCTKSYRER